MSKLIIEMELHKNCLDCDLHQIVYGDSYADTDVYCFKKKRLVGKRFGPTKDLARPSWCPIKGILPEEHGDLIDRYKTAEELNEMADAVYNDFPLVDRETLASWDHGIRMAAQYVQNLAWRKDAAERKDDEQTRSNTPS